MVRYTTNILPLWTYIYSIFTQIIIFQDSSSDDEKEDLEVRLREKALQSMKKGNKGGRRDDDSEDNSDSSD